MSSLMAGVPPLPAGYDGSSDEEDPSSLEPSPTPEDASNQDPRFDHNTDAISVHADTPPDEITPVDSTDPVEEQLLIHARAYQIEMFEKSLKQNIIVAMDTGSGKTQVAVLRIQAELEKSADKIIWFLAPTISLCEQQFRVLKSQIGAAQIKLLSGADNVDTWTNRRIWDDYLTNVRVVVSTYPILLDAITHAFVYLSQLGLIVFDEAHNCVGRHPGSKIMERYRIHKSNGLPCPAILGLTASPIMKSNINGIEKIEQTLDAICKTPTIHREELLCAVKRPVLLPVFVPNSRIHPPTNGMVSLLKAFQDLVAGIHRDPYILHLQSKGTEISEDQLQKALNKRETYSTKQLQSLYLRSVEIHRQLGPWASEHFIHRAIANFLTSTDTDITLFDTMEAAEKRYLGNALMQVKINFPRPFKDTTSVDVSSKFTTLVQVLQSAPENTRCIIFALETATVAVLAEMLSTTTSINDRFQVGTMVGTSGHARRKRNLGELNKIKDNRNIEDFRAGKLNLLVATSVAEEGIDVPACNLVICFSPPANVKSFIQRRGRARMENSRIILLVEGPSSQHDTWIELEYMMKSCYEDDTRVARELAELEEQDKNPDIPPLYVPNTGARLDFDQAKSHLEHFCQKITSGQYVDHRPYYISEQIESPIGGIPRIRAAVHLPSSLPQGLRRVKSLKQWYSEKNAFKDAAFQAFKAVYEAGLVNDNLMPLMDSILEDVEKRSSILEVNGLWKPWPKVAQLWGSTTERVQRQITLKDGERVIARFEASLPCHFPQLPPFNIYWDANNTWTVETSVCFKHVPADSLDKDQTAALIHLVYGHYLQVEDSAHILHLQSAEEVVFQQHAKRQAIEGCAVDTNFLVRNTRGKPHLCIEWLPSRPTSAMVKRIEKAAWDAPDDVPWLGLKSWPPRRRKLLHPAKDPVRSDGRYPWALPVSHCTQDTVNLSNASFGATIPSIIHMLEIYLTAEELCHTVLKGVGLSNTSLILTAICSSAAHETTNYERLEFLGDSILKILATISVMIKHPTYPEGYLSAMKDRIVSNSRLCRASVDKGLDRFILTKAFTGAKWHPLYIKGILSNEGAQSAKRHMSTKTLADVVESLVGAAFIDGGMQKAMACLQLFLPEVEWHDPDYAHKILFSRRDVTTQLNSEYEPLEKLIGYTFRNKTLLVESLTHASSSLITSTDVCMERLEFLGDPILDRIVVSRFWTHDPELSNHEMHLLRTASVNADLLGFLVMEWCTTQQTTEISPIDLTTIVTQKQVPFWKYMRHRSSQVADAQRVVEEKHSVERDAILETMAHGDEYPWAQLAHLSIPKFFSDMFESLIGAVWVDSGSMGACEEIVERIGILPYLRRIISDNVGVIHPKNKLGELAGIGGRKVRYETEIRVESGMKGLFCKVFVGEQFVVEVSGGVNPEEVKTKAADEAYRILLDTANNVKDEMLTG
ncbi:putative RNase3 domain-containing protein [Rosellinia necatrix]|uniref:Putative RNase3 domain-containing protein n=1 Tax=Rosellinia necatrix TaxID=77044 RepID=A0A1S7UL48_ROSNE|nr:putative RNase3 domain-containing protein [Rosellinia necatrix]